MDSSKIFHFDHEDSDVASTINDKDEILNYLGDLEDSRPVVDTDEEDEAPAKELTNGTTETTQLSRPEDLVSSESNKITKKGKKTFALPLDRPSFETFIDHNTTLDDEGYPKLPNGQTVFIRHPGQKIQNWGTFSFTYITSGGGKQKSRPDWRTVRFHCLGVLVCDDTNCDYLGSPPTATGKIREMKDTSVNCTYHLKYDH